ncbi:MAG: hypothetical protein KJ601_07775 [Nanoarchaeota archaeon]|nr:hypothetical protein [Nanoarchaeota archaeon]
MKKIMCFLVLFLMVLSGFAYAQNEAAGNDEAGNDYNPVPMLISADTGDDPLPTLISAADDEAEDEVEDESEAEDEIEAEVEDESEDEAEDIDDETEAETELIVESTVGAQIRILQLQRAILKSTIIAGVVIDVVSEKGEDASALEALKADLEALEDEAALLDADTNSVEDFVNIKKDVMDTNHEFKTISRDLLTADDKQAINSVVKEALDSSEELADLKDQIREMHNELNAERVEKMYQRMGAEDDELIGKIRNGEATRKEVRDGLKEKYDGLTPADKKEAREKIKERIIEKKEIRTKKIAEVKSRIQEIRKERFESRIEKLPSEAREEMKERFNERIEARVEIQKARVQAVKDRLQERKDMMEGDEE